MANPSNSQNIYSLEDILGKSMTRNETLSLIASDANTLRIFKSFPAIEQEKLISFIQGNQGLQIMHDGFAKCASITLSAPSAAGLSPTTT